MAAFLLLYLLSGWASPASAADIQAKPLSNAIGLLLPLSVFVDAGWQICSEQAPQGKELLADAIRNWRLNNSAGALDDLINAVSKKNTDLTMLYRKELRKQTFKIQKKVGDDAGVWCRKLPQLLASPKWQVARNHSEQFALLQKLVKKISKVAALPPARPLPGLPVPTYKQLQQARIQPKLQLVPDAFYCYREKDIRSHPWPDMIIQVPRQGEYRSSFGHGKYSMEKKKSSSKIQWRTGPFKDKESYLKYDRYGQRFRLNTRIQGQYHKFHCFQRGASDHYAQTSFRLRTPQPDSYQCRDLESGKQQVLKLARGGSYQLGKARGNYRVKGIIDQPGKSTSKIIWVSGPLAADGKNKSAHYSEEEGTGLRTLRINTTFNRFVMGTGGSSSKLSALCMAKGEPVSFQKYGTEKAPAPPARAGGLEGFYYTMEDRFGYWEQESGDAPHYYTFFSNGYVYAGEPEADPARTDCSRTLPNGSPLCKLYFIEKGRIRIGEQEALPFKKTAKGLQIGDKQYRPVPRSRLAKLDGRFFHSSFSKWGTMDWGGSNYSKTVFIFTPDGHFSEQRESQNTNAFNAGPTGMNIPGASVYGMGNSRDHNSGSYRIEGHTITFRYNDGRVIRRFIWVKSKDEIYMMNKAFHRTTSD